MTLDELRLAVLPRYRVRDLGDFLQIADADGTHVALALAEPLIVQVDVGVVFMTEHLDLQRLVPEAHELLDAHYAEHFAALGFTLSDEGALVEGEVVDDPDRVLVSWERPMTAEPAGGAALVALLDRVTALDTELVLV